MNGSVIMSMASKVACCEPVAVLPENGLHDYRLCSSDLFAFIAPQTYIAQSLWSGAFATPILDGFFERRRRARVK
jgi:hypothetical protein